MLQKPLCVRSTALETEGRLLTSVSAVGHGGVDSASFRAFIDTQELGPRSCGMSGPEYRRSEMEDTTSCQCPLPRDSLGLPAQPSRARKRLQWDAAIRRIQLYSDSSSTPLGAGAQRPTCVGRNARVSCENMLPAFPTENSRFLLYCCDRSKGVSLAAFY